VVDRPREHARELGVSHPLVERGELRGDLADGGLVVLGRAEVEQDDRVVDVARELLDAVDPLLERRALAVGGLRLLLVVPEPRGQRLPLELRDFDLQPGEVKDAPLAPKDAFGGRPACHASRSASGLAQHLGPQRT
jgi:hypothetical protein